ncbi:Uncharacterized protein C18B11.03c [Grifola frondosa]|uniref:Uncharacterized protein C18B11.03c n=1 Tax=Grifola frondosa TaxID=5627 RepID=A0A1C7MAC6_GRIFR|nr:Uncharacterized protein C18B11.03c [Grifola frondosa]
MVRCAGLLERYHITRHYLGLDSCVIVSAKYNSATDIVLHRAILFAALGKVVQRHPALAVRLCDEEIGAPAFVRLETIDLSQVVEFSELDSSHLEEVIPTEFLRRLDTATALPLWRLTVLEDNTVVFAYHHGIGDGQSGLAFHRALLSALDEVDTSAEVLPILHTQSDGFNLSPPLEECTKLSISLLKILHEIAHLLLPDSWSADFFAWSGNPVVIGPTLRTTVRIVEYTPEETAYGPGPRMDSFSWDTAAKLSATLQKHFVKSKEELGKKRAAGFELSNIGRFPTLQATSGEHGALKWSIGEMYFCQCDAVCGAALKITWLGHHEEAGVSLSWGEGAVDESLAESFFVEFKKTVEALLASHAQQ